MSLGRLLAVATALLMAIACGAVALGIGIVMDPVLRDLLGQLGLSGLEAVLSDLAEGYAPDPAMIEGGLSLGRAILLLVAVPPALNAVVGEVLGWYAQVTPQRLADGVVALFGNPERCKEMTTKGQRLVDGAGARRVVSAMLEY